MNKKKGILTLILTLAALCGGAYIVMFGINADGRGSARNIKQGLDLAGGVSITYQVAGEHTPSEADMSDTVYKMQQRVQSYDKEAIAYKEGTDRINIEIPGVSDANAILTDLGKPGSLVFMDKNQNVVLEGTDVTDAQPGTHTNQQMGNLEYIVQLTLTDSGKEKFAAATTEAAKTRDIIYIIYDGEVISAPAVNEPITGGSAQISGMNSYEEAERIAAQIRIGGLKVELEELRSNVVGAQLGEEAIAASLKAGAIGFGLVAVFMIAVYFVPGFASVLALAIYVLLILLALNGFDITLTLPGIAGIILSIGMAVDANVIIFARIREELATGKTVKSSMNVGFQKALSAIVDGNITTLIAAAVLGWLGSGSVKGFAQTLALGIVLSMFSALIITRFILNAFYAVGIKDMKWYGVGKEKKVINFLAKKKLFFAISAIVIVAGFVFMGVNKSSTGEILNYSLEFRGGTSTNITFQEDMSINQINDEVVPLVETITGDGYVQPQKVTGTNEVIIKTRTLNVEEREAMNQAMVETFGVDEEKITAESISATISNEMKEDAVLAVVVATICMLIYIWLRFKDIRFGASAVIALVHDVLVVLAFYAAVRISVGNTFIACMLTIVGYSINATIVIFDRIRENVKEMGNKEELQDVVNRSISQTLTRSIFTSLTTFFMVAMLYVLGVTSIKEFALPLMAGIVCGAYSSVCITGALWYLLRTRAVKKQKA